MNEAPQTTFKGDSMPTVEIEPRLISIAPFQVQGISARTANRDEADPSKAKLPGLWHSFYEKGIVDTVSPCTDSAIYGVYSDYESDAKGFYTLTAGVKAEESLTERATVKVNGGGYLVFESRGPLPQIVIDTWQAVWRYFENSTSYKRRYTTDFERYEKDSVAIHVAVEAL